MKFTKPLQDSDEDVVHVYQWDASTHSLFYSLCTGAIKINAKVRQYNFNILKRLRVHRGYFLFHINLTKTAYFFKNKEALVTRLRERNIVPLNYQVNDTSKKHLQALCRHIGLNSTLAPVAGDENELLIVKTNFNYGGKAEKRLLSSQSRRLNVQSLNYNTEIIYPVLERKKIKYEDWNNENLI